MSKRSMGMQVILSFFFILVTLFSLADGQPFSQVPLYTTPLSAGSPSYLKIASDQSMIVIAFASNSLLGYTIQGSFQVQFNTNGIGSINQLQWLDGVGPIILASNTIYAYSSNGSLITSQYFPNVTVNFIATSSLGGIPYVSLGISNTPQVPQYKFINNQFVFNQYYYLPNVAPTAFGYSAGHQYFFIATYQSQLYNQALIVTYNCSTGDNNGANPNFLQPGTFIFKFSQYFNNTGLMTDGNGFVYTFSPMDGGIYMTQIGYSNIGSISVLKNCAGSNYFAISSRNSDTPVTIFEQTLFQGQYTLLALQQFNNTEAQMDCSKNYLVFLNSLNQLVITTYGAGNSETPGSTLRGWVIAIIVVGILGFGTGIVVVGCMLARKRKQNFKRAIGMNNSAFMNNNGGNSVLMRKTQANGVNSHIDHENAKIYQNGKMYQRN